MTTKSEDGSSRNWALIAFGVLGLAFLIYFGASKIASAREDARPAREPSLPLVETVALKPVESLTVKESGFLRPRAEIDVVPEVAGKVVEVAPQLEPGGRFAKGEIMFRIDPRTFEADLARAAADVDAAKAELNRAQSEASRQKRLSDIGASAQSRLQQADANLASARARVGQAEAALVQARKRMEDTQVTAPFDAAVISETVALGRYVQPGQSAATIYDTGTAQIVVGLRPADADAVRRAANASPGPLEVVVTPSRASAGSITLTGQVKRFGGAVDRLSRTVPLVIDVPGAFAEGRESPVFANDFVEVTIPARSDQRLYAAPLGTIREEQFIWTLNDDNELQQVAVTPVNRDDVNVIFRSALDLDDARVVLTALTEESVGLKVEIANDKSGSASRGETIQ